MPYRIDIAGPPPDALETLVDLGALDIEAVAGGIAAILPDSVAPERFGVNGVTVSAAIPRDNGSVWLLSPRTVQIGSVVIGPADAASRPGMLRLTDSPAFGTGHHPTTALCIEALEEILESERIDRILDVGTGSGILAFASLQMGVGQAVGVDLDAEALETAAENARLNGLEDRLQLVHGGPEAVEGQWSLIVANVLAAPLMEMAPALLQRLRSRGRLVLSGIPSSLESEVRKTYRHAGIGQIDSKTRNGWAVLVAQASW